MKNILFFVLVAFSMVACNLEKEVKIDLPVYEPQYAVECYLEPGKPFSLLLTNTAGYFDTVPQDLLGYFAGLLVDSAQVEITCNGVTYSLANQLFVDLNSKRVYNYSLPTAVPMDYDHDFELSILTKDGKTITATTRLLPVVPIDSITVEFSETDTLARALTYFTDDMGTTDYYRRMLNTPTLDSVPRQDFTTDDRLFDTPKVAFGTGYSWANGDTLINTLFHIDKAYYDYLESVNNAISSNGNPFGQPSPIKSNLKGSARAIGIFTGLSYDRDTTIIVK